MHGTLYAQFWLLRLRPEWYGISPAEQTEHLNGIQYLLTRYPLVRVDQYTPHGDSADEYDFMLRCESDNPEALRDLTLELRGSDLMKYVELVQTMAGRTRDPQYASWQQLRELARTRPPANLKRHAFVLPVRRTADWPRFPFDERQRMVQEHVEQELPFHAEMHRRCYYCDGLDPQQDFVYYIEARDAGAVLAAYEQARRLRDANYWASHRIAFQGAPVTLEEWCERLLQAALPAAGPRPDANEARTGGPGG